MSPPDTDTVARPDEVDALRRRVAELEHQQKSLLALTRLPTARTDLEPLLDDLERRTRTLLACERATVYVADVASPPILRVRTGQGPAPFQTLAPGQGLAGWVAAHDRGLNLKDASRDPRFDPRLDAILDRHGRRPQSVLSTPITHPSAGLVGVLQAENKRDGYFSPADEQLLQTIAAQAAVLLHHQQLYTQLVTSNVESTDTRIRLQERTAAMELMFGLERVAAVARDLDEALDGALERTLAHYPVALAAVILLDRSETRSAFTVRRVAGPRADLLPPQVLGLDPLLAQTIVGGEVRTRSEWDMAPFASPLTERLGATNFACVPIAREGEKPLGALLLVNLATLPRGFDDRDLETLHVIASRMALSVVLATAMEEERKAERLAAIGGALSGVVHDLRTPLTLLAGYARAMAREDDATKRQETREQHKRQIAQLQDMIHEVLAFARGTSEVLLRKVWVADFMKDLEEVIRHELEGHAEQPVALAVDTGYKGAVKMDAAKMKRALLNLARNAREAMVDGGTLTLGVSTDNDRVVFRVCDTGPGIPKEVEHRLFERFATHGKAHGTGLGLAIVKTIVDQHAATLDVTTSPAGTTFAIGLEPA
jgi:signal transduction histidine kinase